MDPTAEGYFMTDDGRRNQRNISSLKLKNAVCLPELNIPVGSPISFCIISVCVPSLTYINN